MEKLSDLVRTDEKIIWEGKPNKSTFILESIFNPLLPFALIWLFIDLCVIIPCAFTGDPDIVVVMILFFTVHLMPVWIYIFGLIFSIRKYKNIAFLVSDKGVYIRSGLFSFKTTFKPFAELSNITLHQGFFDRRTNTGDILFGIASTTQNGSGFSIINIPDYEKVYKLVKSLQEDIHSDTMFPNEYRPSINRGYKTKLDFEELKKEHDDSSNKDVEENTSTEYKGINRK